MTSEAPRRGFILFVIWLLVGFPGAAIALPKRLVIAFDGISYRDVRAMQEGLSYTNATGRPMFCRGFKDYFPVSRLISTFPSTSDVCWTQIFEDKAPAGYQRTHYSIEANAMVPVNGITSSLEFEKQMTWRMGGAERLALSYLFPTPLFRYELREFSKAFLTDTRTRGTFYAYIYSSDPAQHMGHDIFKSLCAMDRTLEELRATYRRREGRELEILILSDHGNDRCGPGKRVLVRSCLKRAGYHLVTSIQNNKDIVLPTVGIESWVEIHNAPAETEKLLSILSSVEGVDILSARCPANPNGFIVCRGGGERATIDSQQDGVKLRYTPVKGDPLSYLPVLEALRTMHRIDSDGFACRDDWMRETFSHKYPLALERIVQAHTSLTRNPATILLSLKPGYIHATWCLNRASRLMASGGTHGALNELSSTGVLLSNFVRTTDTTASRVAKQLGSFDGRRDYRAEEAGSEWLPRTNGPPELGIWSPNLAAMRGAIRLELELSKTTPYPTAIIRRTDQNPPEATLRIRLPAVFSRHMGCRRCFEWPTELTLAPAQCYRGTARATSEGGCVAIIPIVLRTDACGWPVPF